jgi:hypothetical protein
VKEEEAASLTANKNKKSHGFIAAALRKINMTPGLEKVDHTHIQRWAKQRAAPRVLKIGGE